MYYEITKGDPSNVGVPELVAVCFLKDGAAICQAAGPAHAAFVEKLRTTGVWSGLNERQCIPQDGELFLRALEEKFDHPSLVATQKEGTPPLLS